MQDKPTQSSSTPGNPYKPQSSPTPGSPYEPQSIPVGGPGGPTKLIRPKKNRNRNTRKQQAVLKQAESTSLPSSSSSSSSAQSSHTGAPSAPAAAASGISSAPSTLTIPTEINQQFPEDTFYSGVRSRYNGQDPSENHGSTYEGAKPEGKSPATLSSSAVADAPAPKKRNRHKNRLSKAAALAMAESQSSSSSSSSSAHSLSHTGALSTSGLSSSSAESTTPTDLLTPPLRNPAGSLKFRAAQGLEDFMKDIKYFVTTELSFHQTPQSTIKCHNMQGNLDNTLTVVKLPVVKLSCFGNVLFDHIQAISVELGALGLSLESSKKNAIVHHKQKLSTLCNKTLSMLEADLPLFLSSSTSALAPSATGVLSATAVGAHAYSSSSSFSSRSHASSASSLSTATNYQPLVSGHSGLDSPIDLSASSRSSSENMSTPGRGRSSSEDSSDQHR